MMHYQIKDTDIAGRVFAVGAGQMRSMTLNRVNPLTRQGEVNTDGLALLESMITRSGAEVVILDPLVALCPAGLNDNAVAGAVMREITQLAVRLNVAVLLIHHNRKGTSGQGATQEDASGAAALVNLARVGLGIEPLAESEALKVGVMPSEAWRHFAISNTKANLAPAQERQWFRLETVALQNGTAGYPYGDDVQVVVPFVPQVTGSLFTPTVLRAVAASLAQGCKGGTEPFAAAPQAKGATSYKADVAQALAPFFPTERPAGLEKLAGQSVTELMRRGYLAEVAARRVSLSNGKSTNGKGLEVRWGVSPWAEEPMPGPFAV
jgi:hypothetical protein